MTQGRIAVVIACSLLCFRGAAQFEGCTNGAVADIGNGRCDAALNVPSCGFDGGDCCPCTCFDGPAYSCSDSDFDCVYPDCGDPTPDTSDETTCRESWLGDGYCDAANNQVGCSWDGGDCCECSCTDGPDYDCGYSDYICLDPACSFDPVVIAEYPGCTGDWARIDDGTCAAENNNAACGYDGGDCCLCSCSEAACPRTIFDCLDPDAGDEVFDCEAPPPAALLCSPEVQQAWVVETPAQARALAAAVNCSGGSFKVEWRGSVVVDDPIYVVNGTVLTVSGHTNAVVDGNAATRLFTVVDAVLHLNSVVVTSGSSIVGGAIAAIGSSLTLNQTKFMGNRATGFGGAVFASDGSNVSCIGGGTFTDNQAGIDGGAMFVTGSSMLSCGASWVNNTAGSAGGALGISGGSSVSWRDEATFSYNKAAEYGGAFFATKGSTVSWNAPTSFYSNSAGVSGGAVLASYGSSISWNAASVYSSNSASGGGGAMLLSMSSTAAWNGVTTYENNTAGAQGFGGALYLTNLSAASWSASTKFLGNTAGADAGAAFVYQYSNLSWSGEITTEFVENSASQFGGAIAANFYSHVSCAGNSTNMFVGNTAETGGAVTVFDGCRVSWTGTTEFRFNNATTDGGVLGPSAYSYLSDPLDSTIDIQGPTIFANNSCGANGGVLALLRGISVDIGMVEVTFMYNTAAVAGGAVFVSGSEIGPVFRGVSFVSNSAPIGGAVYTVGSGNFKDVSDIVPPNPTTFERCTFVDNVAEVTGGAVESAAGQDAFVSSIFEGNKAGTGGALRLAGTASLENCSFVENLSDFEGGAAVSNIGSLLKMESISFSGNVFSCAQDMYLRYKASGDPYDTACSGCQAACSGCSFDESLPTCTGTMDHASSSGGTITLEELSINRGYWRANASSRNVLPCHNAHACLGGVTGSDGYCREGYEGPYCSICSSGYTADLSFRCSKCSINSGGIVLAAVLVAAAVAVAIATVSHVVSGEARAEGRGGIIGRFRRYIPLQSVKIVIVAWQILTQFTSVANVTYPDVYQRVLDGLDVFNFDLSWVLSAGCVLDIDFHDRLLMATIGPIIALLFLALTYLTAARINRGALDVLQTIWNKHVSMVLLLTFVVYASVSSVIFMSFACEDLDDGENYLRADYRIKCDSRKHRAFQVYAGLMVLVYPVGIPVFYGVLLFRDREILRDEQADRGETARIGSVSDLWKPYRASVFYYEVIECGRRVLLTGVVVFIYPNTAAQIAITLLMAFVFAVASEVLAPFESRWDAWLSRIGHAVVYVSMYDALLLRVDVSGEQAVSQKAFEGLLVTAHACMVLVVVVETIVLACALRVERREEEPLRRFRPGKALFRGKRAQQEGLANPFEADIYEVELPPVG